MVKVYFETENSKYAELVAKFDSEETYAACFEALESLAKKNGFDFVSESVEEELSINNKFINLLNENNAPKFSLWVYMGQFIKI